MLKEYLKKLCGEFSLSGLKEGSRGSFELSFDSIQLTFQELDAGFFLSSPIEVCPAKKLEDLFSYVMNANFIGQGTGGSTISLDDEEKFLTLSISLPYDMDYKAFQEILEDFINYLEYWREEIKKHQEDAEKFS